MRNDDLQALGRTVTKACTGLGLALALIGLGAGTASAQVPITTLGTPVTENFDSLLRTGGTHSEVPAGWSLLETGDNADQKYGVSTGGGCSTRVLPACGRAATTASSPVTTSCTPG